MKKPTVRKWHSRIRTQTVIEGESKVRREFHEQTKISDIIKRYTRTGELPASERKGQFADVTDLQTADAHWSFDLARRATTEARKIQEQNRQKAFDEAVEKRASELAAAKASEMPPAAT